MERRVYSNGQNPPSFERQQIRFDQNPSRPGQMLIQGNQEEINDLEHNGGQQHVANNDNGLIRIRDRNAGQRIHDQFQEQGNENIQWEPYHSQRDSLTSILAKNLCLFACCGISTPAIGASVGAIIGASMAPSDGDGYTTVREHMIRTDASIGAGAGLAVAFGLAAFKAWNDVAMQKEDIENHRRRLPVLPYSKLAIAGKGILNAPALAMPFQPRNQYIKNKIPDNAILAQALAPVLDEISRPNANDRDSWKNDKRVADLIHVLHDDPESIATNQLVEALHTFANDALEGRLLRPNDRLERIDRIIGDWKKMKTKDFTSMVLHRGLEEAQLRGHLPRNSWRYKHARWADGKGEVSTYLTLKNADLSAPEMDEIHLPAVVKYLGTCQPWKDHLETHAPHYLDHLARIKSFFTEVQGELDTAAIVDKKIKTQILIKGANYLRLGYNGNFLAQWYAEEWFKNPEFFSAVNGDWLRSRLVSEFRCVGLPESCTPELIDKYFDKKNVVHAHENILTSPRAINAHETTNWKVKQAPRMQVDDLEAQKDAQAQHIGTDGQSAILTEQSVLSVNEFIKGDSLLPAGQHMGS